MRRTAFTLIELVIVIAIIGIIAAIAMPKFKQISVAAQVAQEQGMIASIQSSIRVEVGRRAAAGDTTSDLDANPFAYLKQPPPYFYVGGSGAPTQNVTWLWGDVADGISGIACPHVSTTEAATIGTVWLYQYKADDASAGRTNGRGAVWVMQDLSHDNPSTNPIL